MDSLLREAALTGDVASLLRLLEQDSLLLDRESIEGETPLHIASLHGHFEFAETVLCLRPKLACALDSTRHSPLHLGSRKGHIEIVKLLLQMDSSMCLTRDKDGMTPLLAAALKGRVEVVKEIACANKIALRVLSNTREPILHMCVNHNRFDVVKALLECAHDGHNELVKMKDDEDNTILHVTVAKKHIPLTKFLLQETIMKEEVNALNIHRLTALDILLQNCNKSSNDMKLEGMLRNSKAIKASMMPLPKDGWMVKPSNPKKDRWKKHVKWLNDIRSALMVVAILIATVTYQVGANPPGGIWQDDDKIKGHVANPPSGVWEDDVEIMGHVAGQSVMASRQLGLFLAFIFANSIGFIASLMIILLLISGFPLKRRIFIWALMIITWIAVSSMFVTYFIAFLAISISTDYVYHLNGIANAVLFMPFLILVPVLFVAIHIVRIIIKFCWMIYCMMRRGVISIDM